MRIGIIGPIGSGKSTLSKLLSEHYNVPLIEEPVEKNEFLPLFYENKEMFALLSQNAFYSSLFLLMCRYPCGWRHASRNQDMRNLVYLIQLYFQI